MNNGRCTASAGFLKFREDTIIESKTIQSLWFKDTQIECMKNTTHACSITIRLTNSNERTLIVFSHASHVRAKEIHIDSPNSKFVIDEDSSLIASGLS
jgi:hypothetical protein